MRSEKSLQDITLHIPKTCHPSPIDWRDEIFYMLITDRFSDGREKERPLYDEKKHFGNAIGSDGGKKWREEGLRWQGGTFNGIRSKLGYLKNLGVTTLWLSPALRQRAQWDDMPGQVNYHGYAIQNYLDTDPRFGSREELRDLVKAAHEMNMRVVLDIVHNHTGNNWYYRGYEGPENVTEFPYYSDEGTPFGGWRAKKGDGKIAGEEDGVWPLEFQNTDWYWKKGAIKNWDDYPEYERGDFFESKSLKTSEPQVLDALIKVYRYWIYYTDCDGFRIDAAKHVGVEASRKFCNAIREYAELIGKKNFMLMGEVAGSESMAMEFLADATQHGLNAILDINGPPRFLEKVIKGFENPLALFRYYTSKANMPLASHREMGRYHINILDDHDQVWRYPDEGKARFCAGNPHPMQVVPATAFQLMSIGIPALYYGTEQGFDGEGGGEHFDRWIRESMFGSEFGAMRTRGVHFFNENHPIYRQISQLCHIRSSEPALRYGRQYFRPISTDGKHFRWPEAREIIAWSRILAGEEVMIAVNTNADAPQTFYVVVESELHENSKKLKWLFKNDDSMKETHSTVLQCGKFKGVKLTLPPAGMVIMKQTER